MGKFMKIYVVNSNVMTQNILIKCFAPG